MEPYTTRIQHYPTLEALLEVLTATPRRMQRDNTELSPHQLDGVGKLLKPLANGYAILADDMGGWQNSPSHWTYIKTFIANTVHKPSVMNMPYKLADGLDAGIRFSRSEFRSDQLPRTRSARASRKVICMQLMSCLLRMR